MNRITRSPTVSFVLVRLFVIVFVFLCVFLQPDTRSCYKKAGKRPLTKVQDGGREYSVNPDVLQRAKAEGQNVKVYMMYGTYTSAVAAASTTFPSLWAAARSYLFIFHLALCTSDTSASSVWFMCEDCAALLSPLGSILPFSGVVCDGDVAGAARSPSQTTRWLACAPTHTDGPRKVASLTTNVNVFGENRHRQRTCNGKRGLSCWTVPLTSI